MKLKKGLSLILAICMIVSLMPQIAVYGAENTDNIKIVYGAGSMATLLDSSLSGSAYLTDVLTPIQNSYPSLSTFTDYTKTNGFWMNGGYQDTGDKGYNTGYTYPRYGYFALRIKLGNWKAIKFHVPAAGTYDAKLRAYRQDNGSTCRFAYTILPGNMTSEQITEHMSTVSWTPDTTTENLADGTLNGSDKVYGQICATQGYAVAHPEGKFSHKFDAPGDYVLVLKNIELNLENDKTNEADKSWIHIEGFSLSKGSGTASAPMGVTSLAASSVSAGTATTASFGALYGSGNWAAYDTTASTITYVSSDKNIATVAADGTVSAHREGTVKISAVIDGARLSSATLTVTASEDPDYVPPEWIDPDEQDNPSDEPEVPVITPETDEPSGVTVKYDLGDSFYYWGDKATSPKFTDWTYAKSYNLWEYYTDSADNDDILWGTPIKGATNGLQMYTGLWFAVKIRVPVSGMYTPYQDYSKSKSYSGNLETHAIPVGKTPLTAGTITKLVESGEYLVGEASCATSNPTADKDKTYTEQYEEAYFAKGEYYIVFYGKKVYDIPEGEIASPDVIFGNFVLNGGADAMSLEASVSSDKVQIIKGDTANVTTSILRSDGKTVKATEGVSYKSLNTEVLDIDENGKITTKKEGKAIIRMTYEDEWLSADDEMEITVAEFVAADTHVVYDLAAQIPGYRGETPFADFTYESSALYPGGTWAFHSTNSTRTNGWGTPVRYRDWGCDMNGLGGWWAIKIKVPKAGVYAPKQYFATVTNGGILATYAVPVGDTELTKDELCSVVEASDAYLLGTTSCLGVTSEYTLQSVPAVYSARYFEEKEYYIVFYAKSPHVGFSNFELDGYDGMKSLDVTVEENIDVGESYPVSVVGKMLDMSSVRAEDMELSITVSDATVISYSNGMVSALSEGSAKLTATAVYRGETFNRSVVINVTDNTGVDFVFVKAPEYVIVRDSEALGFCAQMNSKNVMDIPNVEFSIVSCEPEGAASIEGNSLSAKAEGEVIVKAFGDFKGEKHEAECRIELRAGATKTGRTLYTDEMIANARENAHKYKWAKAEIDAAIEEADKYLENFEVYYEHLFGEGVPRSTIYIGLGNENLNICRYCGQSTIKKGMKYNFVDRPWKVQCGECKRLFPSNDFESFLKLGISKNDDFAFSRARALEAHRQMLLDKKIALPDGEISDARKEEIEKGAVMTREEQDYYGYGVKGGYLYNDLYQEVGSAATVNCGKGLYETERVETWGVDDGFGYLTGQFYENDPDREDDDVYDRHTYIAYYNYHALTTVLYVPRSLAMAYMYTDDIRYGRAALLLLDKCADIFYDYYISYFVGVFRTAGSAGHKQGVFVGNLDDCVYASNLARACDMLFPLLLDIDEQTLSEVQKRAAERGTADSKTSGLKIWESWENNLLLKIFDRTQNYRISGNEGRYQECIATTAAALDREPESDQMFDWIFQTGSVTIDGDNSKRTGGSIFKLIVEDVDRDGFGNESGAQYNGMWSDNFLAVAETSALYGKDEYDLYKNPKFAKMLVAFADMTLVDSFTAQIGDSSRTARVSFSGNDSTYVTAFPKLKDTVYGPQLADFIYKRYKGELDDLHYDIYTKDPESISDDVKEIIETSGYKATSKLMPGYGLSILRDGENYSKTGGANNLQDFWIYFGGAKSHKHADSLNLGIEAFGLNFAPDNGYPADSTTNPERMQWTNATLAHNTVMVDGKNSKLFLIGTTGLQYPGKVHHFDNSEKVKLMDVSQADAYDAVSEYRRTVVMVQADDDVSYGIDFFRVTGGNEHTFSFHAQSGEDITVLSGLGELVPQVDENGKYIGSFAGMGKDGKGAPYTVTKEDGTTETRYFVGPGADPTDLYGNWFDTKLVFPTGSTWLHSVRRSAPVSNQFAVDFKVVDYRKAVSDNRNLHLKLTMLNDFALDEVAFAKGPPPKKEGNTMIPDLEYMLATRKGENLDSLFTTVYEPYKGNDYIESIEAITPEILSGELSADDMVKAVKVTHKDGKKVDYIIYSTNESVTYRLEENDDMIFNGFVGVWTKSTDDDKVIYSYRHGGDISVTGKISGFQKELSSENYIDIKSDSEVSPEALAGKTIIVSHDGIGNAAYEILSATDEAEGLADGNIRLDIGTVTTVRSYVNRNDFSKGYVYNIGTEQGFVIPMTEEENLVPVFFPVSDGTTSAGSTYKAVISATGYNGTRVTVTGRDMPRGASFDSNTNTFSWKPDSSQVGDNHVSLTATDEFGRESVVHFTVTVYGSTTGKPSDKTETPSTDNAGTTDTPVGAGGGGGGGGGGAAPAPDGSADNADASDGENTTQSDGKDNADASNQPDVGNGVYDVPQFVDLTSYAWAEDAINTLAEDGIIKGTTASTFSPAANITRADFALLLVRAFKLSSDNTENFADVTVNDYYASELAIARNTGIINGIGDNRFAPHNTITRQDMMVIVYRALQSLNVGFDIYDEPQYGDFTTVAEYAKPAVSALIGAGLVNGKSGNIAPTDYTTRAEVAVLIKRILDYVK